MRDLYLVLVLCALRSKEGFFLGLGVWKEDMMNEELFSYYFSTGGLDICAMFFIVVIIGWCLLRLATQPSSNSIFPGKLILMIHL